MTEQNWVFIQANSSQWWAWKRYEGGGQRKVFVYRDPDGRGIGCEVPSEWPPGYVPTEEDLRPRTAPVRRANNHPLSERGRAQLEARRIFEERHPQARLDREFYESGRISDYLANGGPLPRPGQHMGMHEQSMPGKEGRSVMPKREITDLERRMLDWYQQQTHTNWAGRIPCSAYMRGYLDDMARKIREEG